MSICSKCLKTIPAKIIFKDKKVYLQKHCLEHGVFEEILEEDIEYFLNKRKYDKKGTISKTQTKIKKGCPFDCGLCPNHDQHTCIGLIEITNNCDLKCPNCYASSNTGKFLSINRISPGSMSLTYLALIKSKAHVSLARIYAPSSLPKQRGLHPWGSLAAINLSSSIMTKEYAPSSSDRADTMFSL